MAHCLAFFAVILLPVLSTWSLVWLLRKRGQPDAKTAAKGSMVSLLGWFVGLNLLNVSNSARNLPESEQSVPLCLASIAVAVVALAWQGFMTKRLARK